MPPLMCASVTDTYGPNFGKYAGLTSEEIIKKVKDENIKCADENNKAQEQIKTEIGEQLYSELRSLNKFITNLTKFMEHLVIAKQIIINGLNRVKSIGTFKKTSTGFEVVNPEGYVAIDKTGSAVKLVDRMEFAFNNFTAQKNWDK